MATGFNMTTEQDIRTKIAEAKGKISELDILIAKLDGIKNNLNLADSHIPTDGQPFIYQFIDPIDKLPGINVPGETIALLGTRGNADFVFNGRLQIDGDSSFVCHDIQGIEQLDWQNEEVKSNDPEAGIYWGPLALSDLGDRYSTTAGGFTPLFGSDFGFRFTDKGTGRRLFQASVNSNVDNAFIPGRFLGSGLAYSSFGSNYTDQVPFKHVFAKNTAIECEIKVYSSFEPIEELATTIEANNLRIFVGLIGYKVFGD